MRRGPPLTPIGRELLNENAFQRRGLPSTSYRRTYSERRQVNRLYRRRFDDRRSCDIVVLQVVGVVGMSGMATDDGQEETHGKQSSEEHSHPGRAHCAKWEVRNQMLVSRWKKAKTDVEIYVCPPLPRIKMSHHVRQLPHWDRKIEEIKEISRQVGYANVSSYILYTAYECVGMLTAARVAIASSCFHKLVTVFNCVKKFNPPLP